MVECGEQGCKPFRSLHHDLYTDCGIRDRAFNAVSKEDAVLKTYFHKVIGGMITLALLFGAWAAITTTSAKDKAQAACDLLIGPQAQVVKRDELLSMLSDINDNLTSIATNQNHILTYKQQSENVDTKQSEAIQKNRIDIERLKKIRRSKHGSGSDTE